mgnify:CR=1 FL=1|jgi:UDP-N-acetylglucosamine 2-epimerase (non-hydrolysing)
MKKKILFVFGTRPEAIKMAPLVKEFLSKGKDVFETAICVTSQHREMLDQVLEVFDIIPDYDLDVMRENQDLFSLTSGLLEKMRSVLEKTTPELVFVHGDTTTTMVTSMSCFYLRIRVAHIEAGLRSGNMFSPWPEEMNRRVTTLASCLHFAPTESAARNLAREGVDMAKVHVTGNTVIDALLSVKKRIEMDDSLKDSIVKNIGIDSLQDKKRFILITGHRRENFGEGFLEICEAIRVLARDNPNIDLVYPVHLNPNVRKPVHEILEGLDNVYLIPPLDYISFVFLLMECYFVLTDSGGIQEEAPTLGKPVLVMRDTTERPEAVEAGVVKMVGANRELIVENAQSLIDDHAIYSAMSLPGSPYGCGNASSIILKLTREALN